MAPLINKKKSLHILASMTILKQDKKLRLSTLDSGLASVSDNPYIQFMPVLQKFGMKSGEDLDMWLFVCLDVSR